MNVETIGLWAGAVWNALNDAKGTLDVKGLKKATKLKEKEVFGTLESYDGTTVELKTFIKGRKKVYKIPYSDIKNCRFVIKA